MLHVNHHLRGEASDGDEAFVRDLCECLGLPLCVEHAHFADLDGRNLEAAARDVRYAAARRYVRELSQQSGTPRTAARILTAHTASDRAETFFMNAIKGSGRRRYFRAFRDAATSSSATPDRTTRTASLCAILQVAGSPGVRMRAIEITSYLRNFVRHRLMPLAAERNPGVARSVGAACDILGDEDAFHVPARGDRAAQLHAA